MKKKLILILALLGMQNTMQALSLQELKFYASIASYVLIQKLKSYNPFGKIAVTTEEDDFSFDDITPAPKKTYTFKKYKRKYNALGQKKSYKNKKK